ncbi:hypothetical protein GCM10010442_61650 [Kitasatospora kifunensis]
MSTSARFRPGAPIRAHNVWSQNGPQAADPAPATTGDRNLSAIQNRPWQAAEAHDSNRADGRSDAVAAGGSWSLTHRLRIVTFHAVCRLARVLPALSRRASRP